MTKFNLGKCAVTGSLAVLNILLHSIGAFLLWKTCNWATISSQQVMIFNVALCECFESGIWLVFHVFAFLGYERESPQIWYCFDLHFPFDQVLYFLMMAMTLDRLMAVVLGLKYPLYWTVTNTKKLIKAFWGIGIASILASILLRILIGPWYRIEVLYFSLLESSLFIMVALVTYAIIFRKYNKSRYRVRRCQVSGNMDVSRVNSLSIVQTFFKSRFYVSLLIILTYLLFNTIPFCIYVKLSHIGRRKHTPGNVATFISAVFMHLNYTCDAAIYIFLQRTVRKKLFEMVSCSRSDVQRHGCRMQSGGKYPPNFNNDIL